MSAYKRFRVVELQQACEMRGISYDGLNKKGLMEALRRRDEEEEGEGQPDGNGMGNDVEDDGEVTFRTMDSGSQGERDNVADLPDGTNLEEDSAGSETVQVMRLKLALAKLEMQREKQRDEREMRMRERELEIERERAGMRDGSRGPFPVRPVKPDVQNLLPRMSNDTDLIVFFQSYERALLLNDVPKSEWSKFLPAHLTPKANKVLAGLTLQDVKDYEVCKRAILAYFQLNGEAYLKKFRSARKTADENYKMFANRLKDCFLYYVESKGIDSFESLADAVICEQFLFALPSEEKQFVVSRQPKTVDECSNLADVYQEMTRNEGGQSQSLGPAQGHGQGSGQGPKPSKNPGPTETTSRFTQRFAGPKPVAGNQINGSQGSGGVRKSVLCYGCRSPNHKYVDCPQRSRYNAGVCSFCSCLHPANVACNQRASGMYATGTMNDMRCQKRAEVRNCYDVPIVVNGHRLIAVRDTGCFGPTLISDKYVNQSNYTGQFVYCKGAFDQDKRRVPLANVKMYAPALNCFREVVVTVGVWRLSNDVHCLLGNSLFHQNSDFTDILCENGQRNLSQFHESETREQANFGGVATYDSNQSPCEGRGMQADRVTLMDRTDAGGTVSDMSNSTQPLIKDQSTDTGDDQITANGNTTADASDQQDGETEDVYSDTEGEVTSDDLTGAAATLMHRSDTDGQSTGGATDKMTKTEPWVVGKVQTRSSAGTEPLDSDENEFTTDFDISDTETDTELTDTPTDAHAGMDEMETIRQLSAMDTTDVDNEQPTIRADFRDETAENFKIEQRNDPTLKAWWQRAKDGSAQFKEIDGLLHYRTSPGAPAISQDYVLVVPSSYQAEVISAAHDTVFGAHLGTKKTAQRISTQFHFPKMRRKVANHVKCCRECQLTAGIKVKERAPLQPIPILETLPFDDVTVDILGADLPRTKRGNRYLLVIICNVSRWVHGKPIKNCKAETIAEALLEFFSNTSFPKILRCDNMPAFRSELITELKQRWGVDIKYSVPYHAQSHGIVERANRSINEMLRKFLARYTRNWDTLIPLLLSALREVPNQSTGFAPSHLVYGRRIRGLLAIMRDSWTQNKGLERCLKMPVAKYLEKLTEQIKTALAAAGQNVAEAQQKMKERYDRQSTERHLNPGDLALILQPDDNSKLGTHWKGPFPVIRRCERNNYELQVNGRRAMLHINSLRKFHESEPDGAQTETVNVIVSDDFDPRAEALGESCETADSAARRETGQLKFGEQLSTEQRAAIEGLISKYPQVFTDKIGHTTLIQHKITVSDETPSHQPSYRIPEALRGKVEEELNSMEREGIIKYDPYNSWNSPLIVVRKNDGNIRLVNNFIELNKKTLPESYQMTRPDELLNRVAGAKIITKIDLKQSYWQCELTPDSQKYTGFSTPNGVYSYVRMGMGLRNASSTMQKLIDHVLRHAHRYADALQDDILIFSTNFEDHLMHVKDVLDRLKAAGLTVNMQKCHFATNKVKIFGHWVEDGKIYPDKDKVAVISAWTEPKTKKQLKSFVGLCSYFRSYIEDFAKIAYPLTELLAKHKPNKLTWGQDEQAAFDTLKAALVKKPVLSPPDMTKSFIIMSDSSEVSTSAILLQPGDNPGDPRKVIAYASRKLLPRERRYATVEKELLSIVFGVTKFHHHIFSRPVLIENDHRALAYPNSLMKHSNRLARWLLLLQQYDIRTSYISGHRQLADALTRLPHC